MTTTLTDRYVDEALRRLPTRQRPDIEKELRASIADAVDDHLHAGTDPAQAEHAVLTKLGDPARLAAAFADRPLHLMARRSIRSTRGFSRPYSQPCSPRSPSP